MNSIRLQAYAWISGAMGTADNQNQTLKREIKGGTTLKDFFCGIADEFPVFREKVFNPQNGQFSDQVMVIMNGHLVQSGQFGTIVMRDNDLVVLSPILAGG
jgi:hypothetical protein